MDQAVAAREYAVAAKTNNAKDKAAVEVITANCGARAKKLLSSDRVRFTDKKVRELAGTSPEYQQHVIGRASSGYNNPFCMIAATLLVYDTVAFKEVTSRLHRALGMVRKVATKLTSAVESGVVPAQLADCLLTLDLIVEQSELLLARLDNVSIVPGVTKKPTSQSKQPKNIVSDKLHAGGALGLIAKNVRNVAVLQPAHHPTSDQKDLAVDLTTKARKHAKAALKTTRRKFGKADRECRVRPNSTALMRRVITHDDPDGDAIGAAWLAEGFLFKDEQVEVLFVPRARVWGAYRVGDCLVDVGNTRDAKNLFFDHKPPACADRNDSCAARLVWDHLVELGRPVQHLCPFVEVVFAGDSARYRRDFKVEYAESKRNGFHKAIKDAKAKHKSDAEVYRVMRQWLDEQFESVRPV